MSIMGGGHEPHETLFFIFRGFLFFNSVINFKAWFINPNQIHPKQTNPRVRHCFIQTRGVQWRGRNLLVLIKKSEFGIGMAKA